MSQPSILRRHRTWRHFKENIGSLTTEALLLLRSRTDLVKEEIPLNRMLRLCFRSANYRLNLEYFPALDAENTEGNRPDLSWSFYNDLAVNPEECEICFALECKRLGRKTISGWNFNEQYVLEGILRFFKKEKGYGEGTEIGVMVGYIQDSEFDDILHEVNEYIFTHALSIPALSSPTEGWQNQDISRLQHTFQRFSIPQTFLLQHFWIDMRDCPYLTTVSSAKVNKKEEQSYSEIVKKGSKKGTSRQKNPTREKSKITTNTIMQQRLLLEIGTETNTDSAENLGSSIGED